ncbi:MAG: hypothetical protein PWP61_1117 [Trichococcus sp.]|jgi:hypothetical protein|nr:hypothetical protein [Trichococcus sp.]
MPLKIPLFHSYLLLFDLPLKKLSSRVRFKVSPFENAVHKLSDAILESVVCLMEILNV